MGAVLHVPLALGFGRLLVFVAITEGWNQSCESETEDCTVTLEASKRWSSTMPGWCFQPRIFCSLLELDGCS